MTKIERSIEGSKGGAVSQDTAGDTIKVQPIVRESCLSKQDFLSKYKSTETPVVITDATSDWPALIKWDAEYLKKTVGHLEVPVYSSQPAQDKVHQHAADRRLLLSEYLEMLQAGENDLRLFFYNLLAYAPQLLQDFSYPDYGLSFFKKLPVLFMGGKGAKVQMHYDIDLAHLFLCHFGGPKKVLLISPEQSCFMYQVPFSFSSLFDVDFSKPDFKQYPALSYLKGHETVLQHGDTLYIPSGFWHYITYEAVGFSITLRSFPRHPKKVATIAKNIVWTRTVEGLMRKYFGQRWNLYNERRAVSLTHEKIGLS